MSSWRADRRATMVARDAFPEHAPRVFCHGEGQYLMAPTPFGRVELIAVQEGYLVAAESPPGPAAGDGPKAGRPKLPEALVQHLASNGLRPWTTVPSHELTEVIRRLGEAARGAGQPPGADAWCPFVRPLVGASELVGESRQARVGPLGCLIAARVSADPLPELAGVDGVGKRTLVARVAAERGWAAAELPLARVLVERVFQTPIECFLDLALAAASRLGSGDLLVVSDAEMLDGIERSRRELVLRELGLLPRVCLLARRPPAGEGAGVIALGCPGLERPEEVKALMAAEFPDLTFEGAGLDLLVRAAWLEETGVVPGRLLFLVRLARALVGPEGGRPVVLAPDEAANVLSLASAPWAAREADGHAFSA